MDNQNSQSTHEVTFLVINPALRGHPGIIRAGLLFRQAGGFGKRLQECENGQKRRDAVAAAVVLKESFAHGELPVLLFVEVYYNTSA